MAQRGNKCIQALVDYRGMPKEDATELVGDLLKTKDELQAEGTTEPKALISKMIQVMDDRQLRAERDRESLARDALIQRDINMEWDVVRQSNPEISWASFTEGYLVGAEERYTGARDSVASHIMGVLSFYEGKLTAELEEISLAHGMPRNAALKILSDAKHPAQLDFAKEVLKSGSTENAFMRDVADAYSRMAENMRVHENDAGGLIGKLKERWLPQTHAQERIASVTASEWISFVEPLLDWIRMAPELTSAQRIEVLQNIYHELKTGSDINAPYSAPGVRKDNVSYLSHRTLHFKDAASFLAYHNTFGTGTLSGAIQNSMRNGAKRIGLMERLGNNPFSMLDTLVHNERKRIDQVLKTATNPEEIKKLNKQVTALNSAYNTSGKIPTGKLAGQLSLLTGEGDAPVNVTLAKLGKITRGIMTLTRMGFSGVMSVNDMGSTAVWERAVGVDLRDVAKGAIGDYVKRYSPAERQALQKIGMLVKAEWGLALSRLDPADQVPGAMTKLVNGFYKLNLVQFMSEMKKAGHALRMSSHVASSAKESWDNVLPELKGKLEWHGITKKEWGLVKDMVVDSPEIGPILDSSLARNISDEKLLPFMDSTFHSAPKEVQEVELRKARRNIESKILGFFADDSLFAVQEPDIKTHYRMTQGSRAGTPTGEVIRSIMQFKSWPIMWIDRQWRAKAWQKFNKEGVDIPGIVFFITTGMISGYTVSAIKDLIKGNTPKSLSKYETWLDIVYNWGVGGLYNDFVTGQYDTSGPLSNMVMGPTLSTLNDYSKTIPLLARGEGEKAADIAIKSSLTNIPYMNLWFAKAAADTLILDNVKETLSPGYRARRARNLEEKFGQTRYVGGR